MTMGDRKLLHFQFACEKNLMESPTDKNVTWIRSRTGLHPRAWSKPEPDADGFVQCFSTRWSNHQPPSVTQKCSHTDLTLNSDMHDSSKHQRSLSGSVQVSSSIPNMLIHLIERIFLLISDNHDMNKVCDLNSPSRTVEEIKKQKTPSGKLKLCHLSYYGLGGQLVASISLTLHNDVD